MNGKGQDPLSIIVITKRWRTRETRCMFRRRLVFLTLGGSGESLVAGEPILWRSANGFAFVDIERAF
jgi:hypothetical protein